MKNILLFSSIVYCCSVEYALASLVVCDNLFSYAAPDEKHCYESREDEMRPAEIARSWGFHAKEYYVYTEDGYKINIIRAHKDLTRNATLVFGHGIGSNSFAFFANGNKSMVYHYGMSGYDIWIINYRGSLYSRGHRHRTTDDNEYWNFSFHEIALHDLKSALELITTKTKRKVVYIGYSMGTTISYIYSSKMRKHAEKHLLGIISLAPVAYLNNINSFLKYLIPMIPVIRPIVTTLSYGELLPKTSLPEYLCTIFLWQLHMCSFLRGLVFGINFKQIDPPLIKLLYTTILDSVGGELTLHYAQILLSGKFQEKDFGLDQNLKLYGQKEPPTYDLSKISVPVALHVAKNDWIATLPNAARIYKELSKSSRCGYNVFSHPDYTHNDILEATDVLYITEPPLARSIERILTKNCIDSMT